MKIRIPGVVPVSLVLVTLLAQFSSCDSKKSETAEMEFEEEEHDMYDGPGMAAEFEYERTKDPSTGLVPRERLLIALEKTKFSQKQRLEGRSSSLIQLQWAERGPYSDAVGPSNGNVRANNGSTAGRIRAIMVDSADVNHKTVWAGGIDGGLWKTNDITRSPANWVPVNDYLSNLAVTAICQDPTDPNIMYFCTGESYYNSDGVGGMGVFKSTDHGVTWNHLPATIGYKRCTRILCDYQGNIYLATRSTGLLRSTKLSGGVSWTNITPAGIVSDICDLEISSTSWPARLHVVSGILSAQAYRYTDIPATVSSTAGWNAPTIPFPSYSMRAEIAVKGNTLYAAPGDGSYQVPVIYKSIDGGGRWAATAGQPISGWASGQAWYALSVRINPADANQCIVGGLDNYKTSDGGTTWTRISNWVGISGQYVHADQHDLQWWDGGSKLLFACDGGVHFSNDGGVTIRDKNVGLNVKQFYSVAIHPTSTNYFLAGAQDNGTHQLNQPGLSTSVEVTGGDGAFVAIDQDQPQFQFGAYVYSQYRRSTDGGNTWTSLNFGGSGYGFFINPWDYDNAANKIYASWSAGSFMRWDDPQTGSTYTGIAIPSFAGGGVTAVKISPYTPNRVYFGTNNGRVVKVDGANANPVDLNLTQTGMPAGTVSCVAVGSTDQNLMVTFSNYGATSIWVSNNGGASWTACEGNLPDMPVRWTMFFPGDNTKAYIATETGVWETELLNGDATEWSANPSFPTVRTDMIRYRASDRTIAAATHGRGLWTATVPSGVCAPPSIISQPSNQSVCEGFSASFSIAASGTPALTYQWQQSNDGGSSWVSLSNSIIYTGTNSPTLNIVIATAPLNGYLFRCIVNGYCAPPVTSDPALLSINPVITLGNISGPSTLCPGTAAGYISSGTSGGTWTSSNPNVITINSTTGQANSVSPGTATIIYTVNTCTGALSSSYSVTVNPLPQGSISGNGPFVGNGTGQLTWNATAGTGPFTIVYFDGVANRTVTGVTSGVPFNVFTNPVTASTTYTLVSVTDINCTRTSSFSGPSATISVGPAPCTGFAVLGLLNVTLGSTNTVNGNLGSNTQGYKVSLTSYSVINGYVKASQISLRQPVTVTGGLFYTPAGVTLPPMLLNTAVVPAGTLSIPDNTVTTVNSNYTTLTIGKNAVVTINGNIYGTITINAGSKVTFTGTDINIDALTLYDGVSTTLKYTTVDFANDAIVRIKNTVTINDWCRVNENSPKRVTFYLGDATTTAESFTMASIDSKITAGIYLPVGTFSTSGNGPVTITGTVIAQYITTKAKVTFNCGNPIPGSAPVSNPETTPALFTGNSFSVQAYPNPSITDFNIRVSSISTEPVYLRITDQSGRVTNKTVVPLTGTSNINIGKELRKGVYFVEVQQGSNRQVLKLVKLE